MDERAEIGGRTCAENEVFPSQSLCVTFSQKTRITCPSTRARFEDKGWSTCLHYFLASRVILVFSVVASLGKYALRIQNPYLFIDYIENGIAVVYWRGGEGDIALTTHRVWVNRLAIRLQ